VNSIVACCHSAQFCALAARTFTLPEKTFFSRSSVVDALLILPTSNIHSEKYSGENCLFSDFLIF